MKQFAQPGDTFKIIHSLCTSFFIDYDYSRVYEEDGSVSETIWRYIVLENIRKSSTVKYIFHMLETKDVKKRRYRTLRRASFSRFVLEECLKNGTLIKLSDSEKTIAYLSL